MKNVKALLAEFGQDTVRLLKRECRRGWIDVAEQTGRFQEEFSWLSSIRDGFDPAQRFLLEKCLAGDPEANQLRESIIRSERWRWLNESPPDVWETDLREGFFSRYQAEFFQFRSEHYPWTSVMPELASELLDPWPDADLILEEYVVKAFVPLGFERSGIRSTKNAWTISTKIDGRKVHVEFGEGSIHPSTRMTGSIRVPDFDFGISIAHPLFFSGGPQFLFSKSHPYILQLERFFGVFEKLLPTYAELIESTVTAGNDFFAAIKGKNC